MTATRRSDDPIEARTPRGSTTRARVVSALVALVALGAVLACGSAASAGPSGTGAVHGSTPPGSAAPTASIAIATGPTDLVVRARSGGGLVPPDYFLGDLPAVSIYGDGRVLRSRPASGGEGEPLVPVLDEMRLTPQGMAGILAAAAEAGLLGPDRRYDLQGVYDAWTTTFTLTADGRTHTVSAYALGIDGEETMAPAGEVADRQRLSGLFARLLDLRAFLGDEGISPATPYQPERLRVFVSAVTPDGSGGSDVRPWPLDATPDLFGQPSRTPWRCAVVDAAGASRLGLETATRATRWQAGGRLYHLLVRPLLPDESGCPAAT